MSLLGGGRKFEIVYVDRYGRPIGRNSLVATTDIEARRETQRKLDVMLDNRGTRGDKYVAGGYFHEVK